jgi:hypothetical protein
VRNASVVKQEKKKKWSSLNKDKSKCKKIWVYIIR